MVFVKVVKNKAYYTRYQVKWRRRREGKTDYRARRALTTQDKNKYASPKYRLVVRITNKDIVCQIAYAKIQGDVIMAAAYAHELPSYGMPVGLTNYSAAYATGLLLARRLNKKLHLGSRYLGATEFNAEYQVEALEKGPRPFKALLDIGLARTTTGSRIFAAMKGVIDGGVFVPHSTSRFVGHNGETLNGEVLRKYIYGVHVADYMRHLQTEDEEAYKTQFSDYIKNGITADNLEAKWTEVHKNIRAKPDYVSKRKAMEGKPKRWGPKKLTLGQREHRIRVKLAKAGKQYIAKGKTYTPDRSQPPAQAEGGKDEEEEEVEESDM